MRLGYELASPWFRNLAATMNLPKFLILSNMLILISLIDLAPSLSQSEFSREKYPPGASRGFVVDVVHIIY